MLTVMIITSGVFTVPNIEGGIIETLIENFINENEKQKKLKIIVACKDHPESRDRAKQYKYTNFLYYSNLNKSKLIRLFCILFYDICTLFHFSVPKYIYSWNINAYAKKNKIDLFLVEEGACLSFDYFSKKYGRDKMVAHVHSSWPINKQFAKIYGSIIVPSNYTKNIMNDGSWKQYENKISVVKNCIDTNIFKEIDDNEVTCLRNLYSINGQFVILFVGRIVEDKGVLELIHAVKQIDGCKLILVGSALLSQKTNTPYEKRIKKEIEDCPNIIQVGYVEYHKLKNYYSLADVVVSPTYASESAGMVNAETIVMGKPVISTFNGGVPEYVQHERNGILVDTNHLENNLKNAIEYLKKNPMKCEEYKNNNIQDSGLFSCEIYYNEICRHLEKAYYKQF